VKSNAPGHGASEFASWLSENIWRPASLGRYLLTASFQLAGKMSISGGMTKKIPAKVAIPPAVLRTIEPIPSAKIPTNIR
jgi:hypothetical protein